MFKIRIFPILILLLGLILTFIVSYTGYKDNEKIELQDFETKCREFESTIRLHLKANSQILYSSASFISSSDTITRDEWRKFQANNKSMTEAIGIVGIGFSKVIKPQLLSHFEKNVSEEGYAGFKVKPEGVRDFYTAVLYIEPTTKENESVYGHDGFINSVRKMAMAKARDINEAVITDKLCLIRDSLKNVCEASAIMYVPVFKAGNPISTLSEREAACVGWVFCSFRIAEFFKEIFDEWEYNHNRVQVYDGTEASEKTLMLDSDKEYGIDRNADEKADFSMPMNFNGKIWTLYFSNYKNHRSVWARIAETLFMGMIISFLFFILAISLVNARARSRHILKLNEELKKANDSKDRFISVLAHDLKSPFNTLLGFSEILVSDLNELNHKQIEKYVNQIYSTAKITHQLLDELLLWARGQSDQLPFNPENINICQLCSDVAKDFILTAEKKEISIRLKKTCEPIVFADEMMIKTVLRNLLANAIKFTRTGGEVKISGSCENDEVVVIVEDNGIGMSASQVEKLFDISTKTSLDGTAGERGTGLGLLLCKDMIDKHKGRIWVESEPGKGSKFMFSLPLVS